MVRLAILSILCFLLALSGCQTGPRLASLNPFYSPEKIAVLRPAEQADAIRAIAAQSTGVDTPEQQALVQGLVDGLNEENDPLLREATFETIAAFNVPLARETLTAGINDPDPFVRRKCCTLLGKNTDQNSTQNLARVLREDRNFDVRVAAARSLGQAPEGRELLIAALQDRDPAMQFVGVEAMKQLTGQDYGGDVSAYLALARGETPTASPERPAIEVASGVTDWIPFF